MERSRIASLLGVSAVLMAGVLFAAAPSGSAAPRASSPQCPPGVILCFPWSTTAPAPPPRPPSRPVPTQTVTHGPTHSSAPVVTAPPPRTAAAPSRSAAAAATVAPQDSPGTPAATGSAGWSQAPAARVEPALGAPYLTDPAAALARAGTDHSPSGYLLVAMLLLVAGAGMIVLARGIKPARAGGTHRQAD